MNGTVQILNVGAGDTKLIFDKTNPIECARAGRIITDMLRRGYALFVEVEKKGEKVFTRVSEFRENTCEYIIADLDPLIAAEADEKETGNGEKPKTSKPKGKRGKKTVPASGTRAVAMARSAGG